MLAKSCQWWLIWYLLFFCHGGAEGQLQWVVKEKVTAYGQNLTLFCPIENCCSEPAGWSVGPKAIILDVKTFSNDPKVKYHGTYNKEGFGVVIRNLSEADLNVTYRCVYGFDQSTPKYLFHGDVFRGSIDEEMDDLYNTDNQTENEQGQLQWVVKEKVTAYGQNLILFCPVENCCSEPAGWSVGPKSIILDVKTFSNDPEVKYHGTYNKDGFGFVIRNLSEADLNVTYRCVYGFDQSTPKYLLHGDVFRENVPDKDKEIDTTAAIVVPIVVTMVVIGLIIGIVAYCVYRSRIKRQTGTNVEMQRLTDSENQQDEAEALSKEGNNFFRLYLLTQKIATRAVRVFFDSKVLDSFLKQHRSSLTSQSSRYRCTKDQETKLFPVQYFMDRRGILRGKCLLEDCDCSEYELPADSKTQLCSYCGDPPAKHLHVQTAESEKDDKEPEAQQSAQVEPVSGTSGVGPTTFQQDQSAKEKPMKSINENEGDVSTITQESDESAQQSAQVEPVSGTSGVRPSTFQQDESAKKKPMKSNNENGGDVSTIPQESDESAQQSAQVEPVSGTSGVGPTTFQQDQSAKKKPMKSNNENEGDVSTIPQESDESAQVKSVSGTSWMGFTKFQQDQSAKEKSMKSNNENEGDVSTIPQESDESAQQSAQVDPVSGPTTFQQDQSAKNKPMKSNNENEGDVSTIPQESDESDYHSDAPVWAPQQSLPNTECRDSPISISDESDCDTDHDSDSQNEEWGKSCLSVT